MFVFEEFELMLCIYGCKLYVDLKNNLSFYFFTKQCFVRFALLQFMFSSVVRSARDCNLRWHISFDAYYRWPSVFPHSTLSAMSPTWCAPLITHTHSLWATTPLSGSRVCVHVWCVFVCNIVCTLQSFIDRISRFRTIFFPLLRVPSETTRITAQTQASSHRKNLLRHSSGS